MSDTSKPVFIPERGRFRHFPRSLRECAQPVAKASQSGRGFADSKILSDWAQIVGKQLAQHCIPMRITYPRGTNIRNGASGGTLSLQVEPGFATLLQHQEPVILERIAGYFGFRAVARITLLQVPLAHTPQQTERTPVLSLQALQQASVAVRDASVLTKNIQDEALRNVLASLGAAILSRRLLSRKQDN